MDTFHGSLLLPRAYGAFTMETILATAFGRIVNIQRGESDELTKAANDLFRRAEEGNLTSRGSLVVLISKYKSTLYIIGREGEIIKYEWFTQTNCETQLCNSWGGLS